MATAHWKHGTVRQEVTQSPESLAERCATIELLVLDVDGVLSDGGIIVDANGVESKRFHVRDGAAMAYWRHLGKRSAIISGRRCRAVDHRAGEMGIGRVFQGVAQKRPALQELLALERLNAKQACVMGDDLADLPSMSVAGLAVAVADAAPEVQEAAHYVTCRPGGQGAVREVVELVLKAQGRWNQVVKWHS